MADVEPSRVGVCGASYGAYLSVLLSAERPVARLLLRAPALYADDSLDAVLAAPSGGEHVGLPAFVHALRALPMPVLLVESEHDEVISPAIVATYLAAQPAIDRVVLPGAGHALTDPAWRADFQRLLDRLLRRPLSRRRLPPVGVAGVEVAFERGRRAGRDRERLVVVAADPCSRRTRACTSPTCGSMSTRSRLPRTMIGNRSLRARVGSIGRNEMSP